MAEPNCSPFLIDSGILDENKNISIAENHLFTDTVELQETVSPIVENVDPIGDATVCKPLDSVHNCFEMPDNLLESVPSKLDVPSQNSDEIIRSRKSDSGVHDTDSNFVENSKLIDFNDVDLNLSNGSGVMIADFNQEDNCLEFRDEEFHDAVQFFKDPSSLTFLENAGTSSAPVEPLISRSSLYVNFDPLHAKFFSQSSKSNDLQDIVECDTEPEMPLENAVPESLDVFENAVPESLDVLSTNIINKHLVNISPRESLGNILISFDSPVTAKNVDMESAERDKLNEPQKLYTEEELQQALKIQELSVQEAFLKKQHDLEIERTQKQEEMEAKIQKQELLCCSLHSVLKEVVEIMLNLSEKERMFNEKLEDAEKENNRLKEDLKTSVEDLQSVECTFSDFHKRYEQCKSMLKVYTQNEDNLKLQLEDMRVQLQEKEEMYKVLQSRTQEMLDKANIEVSNAKRAGDAQVAVLKAQLKKAELKISSLESDVKHVKIENDKLSGICDELMAKVSES